MAITVMNAAGEIEAMNAPEPADRVRDAQGRFIAVEEKPQDATAEPAKEKTEDVPEWVKRLGITKEQHEGITDVIKRAVNKKHGQAKEAEEFAAAQYSERKLAEQRAEALEREVQRLRAEAEAAKPAPKDEKPQREKFQSDEAFRDAMDDWRVDQKFKAREAEEAKKREEARVAEIRTKAEARVAKAREVVPDFDETLKAADVVVPPAVVEYMQESELFAELGYHFAKHPEDLQRIAAMPTRTYGDVQRLGVALAKIESKIKPFAAESHSETQAKVDDDGVEPSPSNGAEPSDETGSAPSQPRVAAPVTQPLNVGSAAQVAKPVSKMNYDEVRADWEKKNRRDFSRRARH